MAEPSVEPHLFVILGATGDLTKRKLLPALFHLRSRGEPDKHTTVILGAAQPEMSDEAFRLWAYESLNKSVAHAPDLRRWCDDSLHYQTVGQGTADDYENLAKFVRQLEAARNLPENRVFYLALPPSAVPATVSRSSAVTSMVRTWSTLGWSSTSSTEKGVIVCRFGCWGFTGRLPLGAAGTPGT